MSIIGKLINKGVKTNKNPIYRNFREKKLKRTKKHINKSTLLEGLIGLGVETNSVLIVHGSLKAIGYIEGGAQTIINTILELIGTGGTLCVPTISLSGSMLQTLQDDSRIFYPKKINYSYGISKALMKHPEAKRSIHPTHSIGALGKHADWLVQGHESAGSNFGEGTPWHKLSKINGKILGFGIPFGPVTYVHVIEDVEPNFPKQVYFERTFSAKYRNQAGDIEEMAVRAHDPVCAETRIDKPGADWLRAFFMEFLNEHFGLLKGMVGEASSWCIGCDKLITAQRYLLQKGITIYTTEEEFNKNEPDFGDLVDVNQIK